MVNEYGRWKKITCSMPMYKGRLGCFNVILLFFWLHETQKNQLVQYTDNQIPSYNETD